MTEKKILIVCGEPSGDLHAAHLVRELKKLDRSLRFYGVGGERSRTAGVEIIFDITRLALVGIIEVVKNVFVVREAFNAILARVTSERPDLAVLVDYPGFNLRLARELTKRGIPVVYYISPQVWVWGADRIDIIRECVKKIVVFFPFEEELYRKAGVDALCVGHPLVETARASGPQIDIRRRIGLTDDKTTVALLPGSRRMELEYLLPVMAGSCARLAGRGFAVQCVIAKHPSLPLPLYRKALAAHHLDARIVEGKTGDVLASADFAIVASGTATLEAAIIGTPFVIAYKTNPLTAFIARKVARFKYLGLVNILAGKEVAPEFLQEDVTPDTITPRVAAMLHNPQALAAQKEELRRVAASLGTPGAAGRAAEAVLSILRTS